MSHDVYYQFMQTPEQVRRVGSRGGKAAARNRRQRRNGAAAEASQPEGEAASQLYVETTAVAIALLDAQYPWLRGAGARRRRSGSRA